MTLLHLTLDLPDDYDPVSGAPWHTYDPVEIASNILVSGDDQYLTSAHWETQP